MRSVQKFVIFSFLLVSISSCRDHETDVVVKAEELNEIIISTDQAKELYDTYTARRKGLIKDFEESIDSVDAGRDDKYNGQTQQKEDENQKTSMQQRGEEFQVTRYSYYDFETLKKYMIFIEQEAAKANVEISTLRFYFANYPDQEKFQNGKSVKEPKRNTFVLVPSLNLDGQEFAFFMADDNENGLRKAFLLTEDLSENGKSFRGKETEKASLLPNSSLFNFTNTAMFQQNRQSLYGNEGGLRPPK